MNPDVCSNKHGQNPESQATFAASEASFAEMRAGIAAHYLTLNDAGATADEVSAAFAIEDKNHVAPRISELKRAHAPNCERQNCRPLFLH